MLAEEASYTPGHQPRHVRFVNTMKGGLTSTPHNKLEEVTLPPRLISESHPEEIGLHTAT